MENKTIIISIGIFLSLLILGSKNNNYLEETKNKLINKTETEKTDLIYENLKSTSTKNVLNKKNITTSEIKNNENIIFDKKNNISESKLVPRDIDLQSVVGIYCDFIDSKERIINSRGSGIIINSEGYVLTNRHVVDQIYTNSVYKGSEEKIYLKNNECKAYFLESPRMLPFESKKNYSFIDLDGGPGNYDFTVTPIIFPNKEDVSNLEYAALDFSILKFKDWNKSKYSFGRSIPKLHYSPIFIGDFPIGEDLIVPGFAYQEIGAGAFDVLRLSIKNIKFVNFFSGDFKYINRPIEINSKYEPDVSGGRSGSPIFWEGYVVGLLKTRWVPGSTNPHLEAQQVYIGPIVDSLIENSINFELSK